MEIKVKYLTENNSQNLLKVGDWIDLSAAEDVFLKKGEFKLIPLGVAIELPKGYEAIIAPRSSTYKRYKILMANGIGIVDYEYNGDNDQWYMPVVAMEDTSISAGTRICQFRIFENQPRFDIVRVDSLGNEDRGGIGSSGL